MLALLTHPAVLATAAPAVVILLMALVLLLGSDHAAPVARHRIGCGVPVRTISQRLACEPAIRAAGIRALAYHLARS